MKKLIRFSFVFVLFILLAVPALATHIVGGNISVSWISKDSIEVTMRCYRDCKNGQVELDNPATLGLFYKYNNTKIKEFTMPIVKKSTVKLGDQCFAPALCVEEGIYKTKLKLDNSVVNIFKAKKGGLYISYQRCCRNGIINNIMDPGNTGMSFYVEFPYAPTIKNTSPQFGPYPVAYLCADTVNKIDFSAIDPDGDKIVYSLAPPLNGLSSPTDVIVTTPGPYPDAIWMPPYNDNDMIGGVPPMTIDPETGIVTANPSNLAVYTFSIKAEEYRNGKKIGENRMEVQFEVVSCMFQNEPPQFVLPTSDTIRIDPGDTTCFDVQVDDPNNQDWVGLSAYSDMFNHSLPAPKATFTPDSAVASVKSELCIFADCQYSNKYYPITFYAKDSSQCPGYHPTVKHDLVILVKEEKNEKPMFILPMANSYQVAVGDSMCFTVLAADPNIKDWVGVSATSVMFNHAAIAPDARFTGDTARSSVNTQFCVKVSCEDTLNSPYPVVFTVNDSSICSGWKNSNVKDTVWIHAFKDTGKPPYYLAPKKDTAFTIFAADTLCFDVNAKDDNPTDWVSLYAESDMLNHALPIPDASFEADTLKAGVQKKFCITTTCADTLFSPYQVIFHAMDSSVCYGWSNYDVTDTVQINVIREPNVKPFFDTLTPKLVSINGGDSLCFNIKATDKNKKDWVGLSAYSSMLNHVMPGPDAYFYGDTARLTVSGKFCVKTRCEDVSATPYTVIFHARDSTVCKGWNKSDTLLQVNVLVTKAPNIKPAFTAFDTVKTIYAGDTLCMNLFLTDLNKADSIFLTATSELFTQPNMPQVTFTPKKGKNVVGSTFCMYTKCEDVRDTPYIVYFNGEDTSYCYGHHSTVVKSLSIKVLPPPNSTPYFVTPKPFYQVAAGGDTICFNIMALDSDKTNWLDLSANYSVFNGVTGPFIEYHELDGTAMAQGRVCVSALCQHVSDLPYTIDLKAKDDACYWPDSASRKVDIFITMPLEGKVDSLLPNIITPNGDNLNDKLQLENTLGMDCYESFEFVVFNRWGKEVFSSNTINFSWDGNLNGNPVDEGVYYYIFKVKYVKQSYQKNGFIQVIR